MLTHVDLFSGIGGFALAAKWAGVETIAFAEIDSYASRVLKRHWPNVRNYGDVRSVPAMDAWLVTGGVPCQPASVAGKRLGTADDRWLWPEALAAVERIRPARVLFENPTGILSLNNGVEFERICLALESQGYEVQPIIIPACGIGAPHRRNRVWVMAYAKSEQSRRLQFAAISTDTGTSCESNVAVALNTRSSRARCGDESQEPERCAFNAYPEDDVAHTQNTNGRRTNGENNGGRRCPKTGGRCESSGGLQHWCIEPNVGRVANGIPKRVDRLRGLGNAIVPQVAYQLIKRMIEAEAQTECL
jgi:DNA (cytosine-5)-methyltransferase 1